MSLTLPTIIQQTEESGFIILPIFSEHTVCVSSLPFHHRDPFDRILIAQAIVEELTLISKDPFLSEYQVNCIWDN